MLIAKRALSALELSLGQVVGELVRRSDQPGAPERVATAASEVEKTFKGCLSIQPDGRAVYEAALELMRGRKLTTWQRDLVAFALTEPIKEVGGGTVLGSPRLEGLLAAYERQVQCADLWILSWHALLGAYFAYDPKQATDADSRAGWKQLQAFLRRTWPLVSKEAGAEFVPDWVQALRRDSEVLTENPGAKYATEYLSGDRASTDRLERDLGIPKSSWFWHALVLSAVQRAASLPDDAFRALIPKLIGLLREWPAFRDEGIECILVRYHACVGAPPDEALKDYVIHRDVWKNPKLKLERQGGASWNRVPEPVWRMVLQWVNKDNLRDFFELLAARNQADAGRLDFWTRYIEQIAWTRLVFGQETFDLQEQNPEVRKLIASEQGTYARLTAAQKRKVDAFMMQLGDYVVVEFSKKPNACYIYKADQLPFQPYARAYDGGSPDLAVGPSGEYAARIVHTPGWEYGAESELRRLGIYPDRPKDQRYTTRPGDARRETEPDLERVRRILARYPGAAVIDERVTARGRLWVNDPQQRQALGRELEALGFSWSTTYAGWFYQGS